MQKELLFSITKKDFKIDWFSGTGAGGQNRNKHANYCRLTHTESGAVSSGQKHKEQNANLKDAFTAIQKTIKFKMWYARRVQECLEKKTFEQKLDESMDERNLKIEARVDGEWIQL